MELNEPLIVDNYTPETHRRRVLLCNPPIYDTRFPWARFQQPVAILQLSTLLRQYRCDVRLLDALALDANTVHRRRRMRIVTREGIALNWWRFGRPSTDLRATLLAFQQEKWQPDEIYIAGLTTFWWEGVVEMITLIRQHFPHTRIILFGAYPALASEHAAAHCNADLIVLGQIAGLVGQEVDLSLYPSIPSFTYLSILTSQTPVDDLVKEFLTKVSPNRQRERVLQIAFADHDVFRRFPEHVRAVLQASIDHKCKVSFFALGNLHPRDLVENPDLAPLLKRAGFKQLVFADDRHLPLSEEARAALLDDYSCAIDLCVAAGYPQRTEELVGSVCLGRPGEDPEEIISFMTNVAHIVGSLMAVPYQPTPTECPATLPLEMQNGKLLPFSEENHLSFRAYQDILGLAAMLNAKYRSCTFDFLGDGLISRLVRESIVTESWRPRDSQEIPRRVTVGWFNKEGKWVRS